MTCRMGCGACCIAISISSPIPGMPEGKKAGERCIHLDESYGCRIHGREDYPKVCRELRPDREMCGETREQAMAYLEELERLTAPG
ncbi:MAG: YkgJ family cysteine cluster protein [Spirochaetales bacterium]|nr:YkgJ family cysteine cluster protein [Spirochaetales bacterium]